MPDRQGLKDLFDAQMPTNGAKAIQAVNVREPLKTTVDETILPQDYQSAGLFIPTSAGGVPSVLGFTANTLDIDWDEAVPPSGATTQDPASGVETITIGVQGRYQVSFAIGMEYNETDTIFLSFYASAAGGQLEETNAGSLMKFRRNQIDLATTSITALFDIEPADLPFVIQPRFFSDSRAAAAVSVLYANFELTGWGRTNDGTPDGRRIIV